MLSKTMSWNKTLSYTILSIIMVGGYLFISAPYAMATMTNTVSGSQQLITTGDTLITTSGGQQQDTGGVINTTHDIHSDDSLYKYVSLYQSFTNSKYRPRGLTRIKSDSIIVQGTGMRIRKDALPSLVGLSKEFHTVFDKKIVIISAYRSYTSQKSLKDAGCPDTRCAPAGHSEHQGGLAIDLYVGISSGNSVSKESFNTIYYPRLSENAHRYGRHNTYQKGVEIDTYQPEPRHWRYVGRDLATELYEQQMTLAEWFAHHQTDV